MELRNQPSGVSTLFIHGEDHMKSNVQRELLFDATESQNPGMCGNSMRGNRETPEVPPTDGVGGQSREGHELCVRHARNRGVGRTHNT